MVKNLRKNILLVLGLLLCLASLSTMFWGSGAEIYGSIGKAGFAVILAVIGGGWPFLQYVFDQPMQLGLIRAPVDCVGCRIIVLCLSIILLSLPLLVALGVYD